MLAQTTSEQSLIILNPAAGRGLAGQARPELERTLRDAGIEYTLVTTHARGGATELAWQGIERGYRRIVAVGGDGTINEVVNGIKGAERSLGIRARLGIIPAGTGSDFIKSLDGITPGDIRAAVQRLAAGRTRLIDVGRVQIDDSLAERYFVNALEVGFDAQVAIESYQITWARGIAVYLIAMIRALANYKAHPMTVSFDGRRIHRRLLLATIANGRCQGGGFWFTPEAQVDDGLLDLCLIDNLRLDQIIRHLPKLMEGTHTQLRQVTIARGRNIQVESATPIPVATDGEVLAPAARRVVAEVLPAALEVFV